MVSRRGEGRRRVVVSEMVVRRELMVVVVVEVAMVGLMDGWMSCFSSGLCGVKLVFCIQMNK